MKMQAAGKRMDVSQQTATWEDSRAPWAPLSREKHRQGADSHCRTWHEGKGGPGPSHHTKSSFCVAAGPQTVCHLQTQP